MIDYFTKYLNVGDNDLDFIISQGPKPNLTLTLTLFWKDHWNKTNNTKTKLGKITSKCLVR